MTQANSFTVIVIIGTRPEAIKLTPVIKALEAHEHIQVQIVSTCQQADLVPGFIDDFALQPSYRLTTMQAGQPLNQLLASLLEALDPILMEEKPDAVIVQGDTTSALAGAMAARMQHIDVVHVEAGLRTSDSNNPFPEELNRRMISQLTQLHCSATENNKQNLLQEGVSATNIAVTGNPVIDAVSSLVQQLSASNSIEKLLDQLKGQRILLLTTHRRENFGDYMKASLHTLHHFVERYQDVALVFPVHPNPAVSIAIHSSLPKHERIHLIEPLLYGDFIRLCQQAWLIVSDSGGLQEEAASLGKPLLILRSLTERPEAINCGIARLIGKDINRLEQELDIAYAKDSWAEKSEQISNPFGDGNSGTRIANAIYSYLIRAKQ